MNELDLSMVSAEVPERDRAKRVSLRESFFSIKTLIAFLLGFFILAVLSSKMNLATVFSILKNTRLDLFALGFVSFYGSVLLRAFRWRFLLGNIGCRKPLVDIFEVLFLSWFANVIIPAKLGDVYRSYLIHKNYGFSVSKALGSVFTERIFDLAVLLAIFIMTGTIALGSSFPKSMMYLLLVATVISFLLISTLVCMKMLGHVIVRILPRRLAGMYERFQFGTTGSVTGIPKLLIYTTFIWLLESARLWCVIQALGSDLPLVVVVFVALCSSLLTTLPITPAGLGAVEVSMIGILGLYGVPPDFAAAIAILDRLISYWSIIPIGYMIYIFSKKT